MDRRRFLRTAAAAAASFAAPPADLMGWTGLQAAPQVPDGRLIGIVPFEGQGRTPLNQMLGVGLDARRFNDLSDVAPDRLLTPEGRFYVRTASPDLIDPQAPWSIALHHADGRATTLTLDGLAPRAKSMGPLVMECAGNNDPANYGLLSTAEWSGVPLTDVIDNGAALPKGAQVLVSGFDRHSQPSRTSIPGASWIFSMDQIRGTEAFLATTMNGRSLPRDHGAPVRLIVPGWYGCTCIKWVNEIRIVGPDEPPTGQMREFAGRILQDGMPDVAREFRPAAIQQAAVPVRVERWTVGGKTTYRVAGVTWGGERPSTRLVVRFRSREPFVPVEVPPAAPTGRMWSLWSHWWTPPGPGRYTIVLRVDNSSVPTERLDRYFYARAVSIPEA
jgi:DMSO/TMAO reductase YedYZ molybdopterin-dependent catalytic subunit